MRCADHHFLRSTEQLLGASRVKFSIRGILAITTFVALLLAAFVSPPAVSAAIILSLWPMLTTIFLGLAIYSRGTFQAFATGATVPTAVLGTLCGWSILILAIDTSAPSLDSIIASLDELSLGLRMLLAFATITSLVCGAIMVVIQWMFREGRQS